MGIEPTYSAWKADVLPLNHTCISVSLKGFEPLTLGLEGRCSIQLSYRLIYYVFRKQIGVTGFEPATPWSQTRYSSQTEPHPDDYLHISLRHIQHYIWAACNVKHFFDFFKEKNVSQLKLEQQYIGLILQSPGNSFITIGNCKTQIP